MWKSIKPYVGGEEFPKLWSGEIKPSDIERHHTDELALMLAKQCNENNSYLNMNTYALTSASILDNLRTLFGLGIIRVSVLDFYETSYLSNEFFVILQKAPKGMADEEVK